MTTAICHHAPEINVTSLLHMHSKATKQIGTNAMAAALADFELKDTSSLCTCDFKAKLPGEATVPGGGKYVH